MNTKKEKAAKRLTVEELRNCKGFENYTDEEAEEVIQTLERLSILFYELHQKELMKKGGTPPRSRISNLQIPDN